MDIPKKQTEWAKELKVSAQMLRRAVRCGQLGVVRLGRLPYHSEGQIQDWLFRTTVPARSGRRRAPGGAG